MIPPLLAPLPAKPSLKTSARRSAYLGARLPNRSFSIPIESGRSAETLFIRAKKERYIGAAVSYQSDAGPLRYAIKTTNDVRRKQYVPFLHQCRIRFFPSRAIPSARSFPSRLAPRGYRGLSVAPARPVVRDVCSGSLTCCMLFCPGRSARFWFSEPFYTGTYSSRRSPARHPRNKKPYCSAAAKDCNFSRSTDGDCQRTNGASRRRCWTLRIHGWRFFGSRDEARCAVGGSGRLK